MFTNDAPSNSEAARSPKAASPESDRRGWILAWLLALILHAALIGMVVWLRVPVAVAKMPQPEVIQVRLSPELLPDEPPRAFTELPSDRKDAPPEKSNLLSNVTSRARDREPGGSEDRPRSHGETDASVVKLEKEESPSRPPPPTSGSHPLEPADPNTPSVQRMGSQARDSSAAASRAATDLAIRVTPGSLGNAGIHQPDMESGANAGLNGDVSLNTTAWEYAPWMERFSRRLMDHWVAPLAYSMGMLKDGGYCVLEAEISKSGELLRLDLLDQQEHRSLTLAAQSAVRSMAPMEKLPADFPEPTLILRLRMIYPAVRAR